MSLDDVAYGRGKTLEMCGWDAAALNATLLSNQQEVQTWRPDLEFSTTFARKVNL